MYANVCGGHTPFALHVATFELGLVLDALCLTNKITFSFTAHCTVPAASLWLSLSRHIIQNVAYHGNGLHFFIENRN